MSERGDWELLTDFVERADQRSFGELVARYAGIVYGSALRQVRDTHAAEDVSQAAFIVLARRAASIKSDVVLGAWLLTVTRFAARDYLKTEARRRKREQASALQRIEQMPPDLPPEGPLDSVLDDAMARLSSSNRDALVLRYFQEKGFDQISAQLGISEVSARQRVSRALEKLRKILNRRREGMEVNAQNLGPMLAIAAVARATPDSLAPRLAAAALKGAHAAATPAALAKGVVTIMAYSKAKSLIIAAAALLFIGGSGAGVSYYILRDPGAPTSAMRTDTTNPQNLAATTEPNFTWTEPALPPPPEPPYKGPPIKGIARMRDGSPVADAEVILSYVHRLAMLPMGSGKALDAPMTTKTGPDGQFYFAPAEKPLAVIVRTSQGFGSAMISNPASPLAITLEPWGRVEGVYRVGSKPLGAKATLTVKLEDQGPLFASWGFVIPRSRVSETDETGRFVIEQAPPGRRVQVGTIPMPQHYYGVDVVAGATVHLTVGGDGRPLIGRISPMPAGCNVRLATLTPVLTTQPSPRDQAQLEKQRIKMYETLRKSAGYYSYQPRELAEHQSIVLINPDGTFHFDDITAGQYQLKLQLGIGRGNARTESLASMVIPVTVARPSAGRPDDPQDLGPINIPPSPHIEVAAPAPELIGIAANGKPVKLSDLHGKYVLLSVVSGTDETWEDTVKMLAIHDRFADDPRLAMVTFNHGPYFDEVKQFLERTQIPWPVAQLDDRANPSASAYMSSEQRIYLIDPQGKVVLKNLTPSRAFYELDKILSSPLPRVPGIAVVSEKLPAIDSNPAFHQVPPPASPQAVVRADFTIVDGLCGVDPKLLHDGQLPQEFDDPQRSFRFHLGTLEGRVKIDLRERIEIARISTYSRHNRDRGPQLYRLFASNGDTSDFNPSPKIGIDPAHCGWTPIATVDTRPKPGPTGGWYGSNISSVAGSIGNYQYLLFEMFPTETVDAYGHTFYGEIQVIARP